MPSDATSDLSLFRVTLFVGPQAVEGEPFTYSTVFNVKKRSWKGGIQVAIELRQDQIEAGRAATDFDLWLKRSLSSVTSEEHPTLKIRAHELFIEALCRCKLDWLLQSGMTQESQRFPATTCSNELESVAANRTEFITAYVATELDLPPIGNEP